MNNQNKMEQHAVSLIDNNKGFHPVYILAGLYSFTIYLYPILYLIVNMNVGYYDDSYLWPLALPIILFNDKDKNYFLYARNKEIKRELNN